MSEASHLEALNYLEVPDFFLAPTPEMQGMVEALDWVADMRRLAGDSGVESRQRIRDSRTAQKVLGQLAEEEGSYETGIHSNFSGEGWHELHDIALNAIKTTGYTTSRPQYPDQSWFCGHLEDGTLGTIKLLWLDRKNDPVHAPVSLYFDVSQSEPIVKPYVTFEERVHCELIDGSVSAEVRYRQWDRAIPVDLTEKRAQALGHLIRQINTASAPLVDEATVLAMLAKYGGRRLDTQPVSPDCSGGRPINNLNSDRYL